MVDFIVLVGLLIASSLTAAMAIVFVVVLDAWRTARQDNERLRRVIRIERNKNDCLDEQHELQWDFLWEMIRIKFNFYKKEDGTWYGGQPAKEIWKTMRDEFGTFNLQQMAVLERILNLLVQARQFQIEHDAALNPVDKDIVFDGEGGFKVISKIKPCKRRPSHEPPQR